jgi:uncharacterized protein (DUF433 family)
MSRNALTERDLREVPAYSIAEAAGYLQIPKSTLRAWLLGQQSFRSVIDIADRKGRRLSFINLVEAFVLAGMRREHIRRGRNGVPEKIVLFPGASKRSASVVIDPRLSFGRPVLDGLGVRTSILAERFTAGESIDELARAYSAAPEAVQNALRCELLAA